MVRLFRDKICFKIKFLIFYVKWSNEYVDEIDCKEEEIDCWVN